MAVKLFSIILQKCVNMCVCLCERETQKEKERHTKWERERGGERGGYRRNPRYYFFDGWAGSMTVNSPNVSCKKECSGARDEVFLTEYE